MQFAGAIWRQYVIFAKVLSYKKTLHLLQQHDRHRHAHLDGKQYD